MSTTLDEKLADPLKSEGGNATATLTQLLKRWRTRDGAGGTIEAKKPPELVLVFTMARETWKRVGPISGGSTTYELIETRALEGR